MLRKIVMLLLVASSVLIQASTETKSKVKKVTVFLNGAQVTREFKAKLTSGTQTLRITDLSPYLDAKTIQVKGNGEFTILSIRHQMNYIDVKEVEGELKTISDSMNYYQRLYKDVDIELNALSHSEQFLQSNRMIKGNNDNLDVATLKGIHKYYYEELLTINKSRKVLNYKRSSINAAIKKFTSQLNAINGKLTTNTSEVLLELQAKNATSGDFMVSYLVNNASWYPSYDIRVQDINKPLQLVYKANVQQNTGEDWNSVNLTFSNANPYQSGDLPVLKPYYLNYTAGGYSANPYKANASQNSYNINNYISSNNQQASGRVVDQNGGAVAYATIKVQGTSVGSITDENGNFSITLPQGKNQLFVSSLGYADKYQAVAASGSNTIALASTQQLAQIMVVEDARSDFNFNANAISEGRNNSASYSGAVTYQYAPTQTQGLVSTSYKRLSFALPKKDKQVYVSKPIAVMPMENQTSLEITLDIPFTIESNGKPKVISINEVEVPAYYEYRTVPKLEKAAFLMARVADWGEYNLLEGEANLYFESTYIGKSILDVRFITDTLNISLGRDKNVLVNRQKVKSQTTREFIGKETIEKRQFELKVRNNKGQAINLIVYDQIPISQRPKDIEVILKDKNGANHTLNTGELKWELKVDPNKTEELNFKYQVKFPKGQNINLE
jgi:hypothetical protein